MAYLGKTPSQAVRSRYYFTATGGETSLSGTDDNSNTLTFTDGNYVDVSLNGVALVAGSDYNTTTANTIGGLTALTASDVVEVVVYDTFSVFSGNVNSDFSVGGDLTITGTTTTSGNINFGDNDKAVFGAGSDLQIYHDGNNSILKENGTGGVLINNPNDLTLFDANVSGGVVKLFHVASGVSSEKLRTTSSGIDVTGSVTAQRAGNVTTGADRPQVILNNTSSGGWSTGTEYGSLEFHTDDTTSGAGLRAKISAKTGGTNGSRGVLGFTTRDSSGTAVETMTMTDTGIDVTGSVTADEVSGQALRLDRVTSGNNIDIDVYNPITSAGVITKIRTDGDGISNSYGALSFHTTRTPNTLTQRMRVDSQGDISFFADDGTTQGLFWDASTQRLGINTTSPDAPLEIETSGADFATLKLNAPGNTTPAGFLIRAHDGDFDIRDANNSATRMTIDSSGRVGIGVVPTGSWNLQLASSSGSSRIRMQNSTTGTADGDGGSVAMENNDFVINNGETGVMKFETGGSETARFDSSGRLYMGTSTFAFPFGEAFLVDGNDGHRVLCSRGSTATREQIIFYNPNGDVGSIDTSGSSTSYNTSSDHRLKENVADMTGAIARVKQLAPKRFNFIADPDDTMVDGFLAHEAQTVVPEAVTGTHNEVDDDGNAVMQGIDQSKLVPLLTGALQEAIAKIEALETSNADLIARIETLENA